jgi:solute carrier family 45 protein 1/2/4
LGALSDRCQSRFGRRRPFIFFLGIGAFLGITLFLNNIRIGKLFGDSSNSVKAPINAIILVAIGVTLLDFCADSSDSPLRALILDVCNQDDQDTGFNIHAILGGLGSAFGYVLSAIDWEKTFFKFIGKY